LDSAARVRHFCILVRRAEYHFEPMNAAHDIIATSPQLSLAIGGFIVGALFGALAQVTNYCVMGAITEWRVSGDKARLGAAALAAAVAILGAQLLDAGGITDLAKSIYLIPRLNWIGAISGGLLFGYGMVFAGGCPSRVLVRAGGGDLRALVALMALAVAALAALSGILGEARVGLERATAIDLASGGLPTQSATDALGAIGLRNGIARIVGIVLIGGPLLAFAVGPARILSSPRNLAGGLGVGLLVSLGWALSGLAYDDMTPSPAAPTSLSFVKPVSDAIDWLERSTALGLPGFAAANVFGVLAGSFLAAIATRSFRYAGFADRADLGRHVLGAVGMGIGGVLAMGCTIGQGVTGLSTLSLQSIPAVAAIVGGAVLALERLKRTV
jgi:uncharacterized membrane protein YedE/YeeE